MGLPVSSPDVSGQFALDTNALGKLKQQAKSDPKQALSAAASQFEALFMQMLLKSMREALPQDGPLASDTTKTYTGMFDQQVAQQLAKKGLGIANVLVKQLEGVLPHKAGTPTDATSAAASIDKARAMLRSSTTGAPPAKESAMPVASAADTAQRTAAAGSSLASNVQQFVDKLRPYAQAVAQKMGVPAEYLIAQAGLETGWGRSAPRTSDGASSNNLFGIKAQSGWRGATADAVTSEYNGGRMEKTVASFRAYGSIGESLQDFARLLQSSRYAGALANTHDPAKYASSLQQAGYATDPRYAEKLTRAIQTVTRVAQGAQAPAQVAAAPADKRSSLV